jgi:hypothetical protein
VLTIARLDLRYTADVDVGTEAYNGGQRGVAEVLRCADRWGREVVLYEDTLYDTIVVFHGYMANKLDAIVDVLVSPERVNFDALHPNGENFYGRGYLAFPEDHYYLKVVVRYERIGSQDVGTIVSAYAAPDYRKRGERFKWHRR